MFQVIVTNSSHVTFKYFNVHLTLNLYPQALFCITCQQDSSPSSHLYSLPIQTCPFGFPYKSSCEPLKLLEIVLISKFGSNRNHSWSRLPSSSRDFTPRPVTTHCLSTCRVPGPVPISWWQAAREQGLERAKREGGPTPLAGTMYGPDSLGRSWRN